MEVKMKTKCTSTAQHVGHMLNFLADNNSFYRIYSAGQHSWIVTGSERHNETDKISS